MNKIDYMKFKYEHLIIAIPLIITIVCSSCFISKDYIEGFTYPKWIMFTYGTSIMLILTSIIIYRKDVPATTSDLLIGVILSTLITILIPKSSYYNDVTNLCLLICFCTICRLISLHTDILKVTAMSFILGAGISTAYALLQLFKDGEITGCYDNIVGLDITLILGIFSIIFLLKNNKFNLKGKILFILIILIFLILILISKSRLAVLTSIVVSFIFFPKIKKLIIIPILASMFIYSYCITGKYESSCGRAFILKTSISLLNSPEKILNGYGENGFSANYMLRQSELLKNESEISKQRAANIAHPLNEFVLSTIKYGIVFTVIVLTSLGIILFSKDTPKFGKAIILTIMLFSFFSYPMKYPISWIALGVGISSYALDKKNIRKIRLNMAGASILIVIATLLTAFHLNSMLLQREWKSTYTQAMLGKKQQALTNYLNLSKRLKSNEFRYNHASYLHNLGLNFQAKAIMSNIDYIDYETEMLIGRINVGLEKYNDALKNFILASEMCPNRFLPLFEIYKIYETTNNKEKMEMYRELIKNKNVKIPSPQIDYIKKYVSSR